MMFNIVWRTKSLAPVFCAGVSFKSGPGMQVSRAEKTKDRAKAARFSLSTAIEVASQFNHWTEIQRENGSVEAEATKAVAVAQVRRLAAKAEVDRVWTDLMQDAMREVPGLADAVKSDARLRRMMGI